MPKSHPDLVQKPLRGGRMGNTVCSHAEPQSTSSRTIIESRHYRARLFKSSFTKQFCWTLFATLLGLPWVSVGKIQTAWLVAGTCDCCYAYSKHKVDCIPFTPTITDLAQQVAKIVGVDGFNSVNINLYEDGANWLGWHSDNEALFQALHRNVTIASLSLGATRNFDIRDVKTHEYQRVRLADGDLCTMEGLFQKFCEHSIPCMGATGPRINLTFRNIVQHNESCPFKTESCRVDLGEPRPYAVARYLGQSCSREGPGACCSFAPIMPLTKTVAAEQQLKNHVLFPPIQPPSSPYATQI